MSARIGSRHWFWILLGSALLWVGICSRFSIQRDPVRHLGNQMILPLLSPLSYPFNAAQSYWQRLFDGVRSPQLDARDLQDRNIELQNQSYLLMTRIEELENTLSEYKQLRGHFPRLSQEKILPANIIARGGAMVPESLSLDKGTQQGVYQGAVVLCQLAPLGRIISVGPYASTLRQITDRGMKITARLVRPSATGSPQVVAESCLVAGTGAGTLRCETIDSVRSLAPQAGDLLLLQDNEWPLALQGAVLGEVTSLSRLESQMLRWDLKIRPRADAQRSPHVVILLPAG